MLAKKNRLKKNGQFNYVYKKGNKSFAKPLTLVFVQSKNFTSKFGFSISKKIGKAHDRNLLKRRMREIIRLLIPTLKKNVNYVFVARDGIQDLSYKEINDNFIYVLKKANLFDVAQK